MHSTHKKATALHSPLVEPSRERERERYSSRESGAKVSFGDISFFKVLPPLRISLSPALSQKECVFQFRIPYFPTPLTHTGVCPSREPQRRVALLTRMPSPLHLTSAAKLLQAGAFFHAGRGSTAGSMIMKGSVTTSARPGLRTFLDGKKDGHTIVFVHGWPDDHSMWDKQVCCIRLVAGLLHRRYASFFGVECAGGKRRIDHSPENSDRPLMTRWTL